MSNTTENVDLVEWKRAGGDVKCRLVAGWTAGDPCDAVEKYFT